MVKSTTSNEGVQELDCNECVLMEDEAVIAEELQEERKRLYEENKMLKVENFVLRIFCGERMMLHDNDVDHSEVIRLLNLIEERVGNPYTNPGYNRLRENLSQILIEWKMDIEMERKTKREDHDVTADISPDPDATEDSK